MIASLKSWRSCDFNHLIIISIFFLQKSKLLVRRTSVPNGLRGFLEIEVLKFPDDIEEAGDRSFGSSTKIIYDITFYSNVGEMWGRIRLNMSIAAVYISLLSSSCSLFSSEVALFLTVKSSLLFFIESVASPFAISSCFSSVVVFLLLLL